MLAFLGGAHGEWEVTRMAAVIGAGLPAVSHVAITQTPGAALLEPSWTLTGVTSNLRYTTRVERDDLRARSPGLGQPGSVCAALIPIRKSQDWWDMAQDERRDVLEAKSRHIATGLAYVPQIARQLLHCREIGGAFDFLTWFEFAPEHENAFDDLVATLRASPEWSYVDREFDIRLRLCVASARHIPHLALE